MTGAGDTTGLASAPGRTKASAPSTAPPGRSAKAASPEPTPTPTPGRTVAALVALWSVLPATALVTAAALLRGLLNPPRPDTPEHPRTILISGGKMTKALHLARAFHRAGHRVILVEAARYRLTGHRFSRAVDRFYTVPPSSDSAYPDALLQIVRQEGVDLYVPVCSPASASDDARARAVLEPVCEVFHPGPEDLHRVDDKHAFALAAAELGLPVPDAHRITDPDALADFDWAVHDPPYVLKSIAYDPVRRLDLTPLPRETPEATRAFARAKPISQANPWVMQHLLDGEEFCTHSTVRDGVVQLHCCCRSSAWQLNYEMVDEPEIEAWVRRFVAAHGLTGQFSFDFIRDRDGTAYAIECNPRTHSAITMFYDHPDVARAYLEDDVPTVLPTAASRPTYWLHHELFRLLRHPTDAPAVLRRIARGKEAIFSWADPLPFLLVHQLQIPSLLLANLRARGSWVKIDFNIGKLVEPGGD